MWLCFNWQGEWLLLFNYLIPFSELLEQSGQALDSEGGGARVNIKTEQVRAITEKVDTSAVADVYITHTHVCVPQICKFLVSLSKDFSSYYNRVHVLGVRMYSYMYVCTYRGDCVQINWVILYILSHKK